MRLGRGTTVLWCRERCWECKVASPSFCLCTSIWTGDRGRPSRVRSSHSLFFLESFLSWQHRGWGKKRTRDRREREKGFGWEYKISFSFRLDGVSGSIHERTCLGQETKKVSSLFFLTNLFFFTLKFKHKIFFRGLLRESMLALLVSTWPFFSSLELMEEVETSLLNDANRESWPKNGTRDSGRKKRPTSLRTIGWNGKRVNDLGYGIELKG